MPVGHYGNGFKSGSMRLGKDALVFTKHKETRSLGFLSQTYLAAVKADTIFVPIVSWSNITNGELVTFILSYFHDSCMIHNSLISPHDSLIRLVFEKNAFNFYYIVLQGFSYDIDDFS